jgi:hypothetical protein
MSNFLYELYCLAIFLPGYVHGIEHADSQIFGHEAFLYALDHASLQSITEELKLLVLV